MPTVDGRPDPGRWVPGACVSTRVPCNRSPTCVSARPTECGNGRLCTSGPAPRARVSAVGATHVRRGLTVEYYSSPVPLEYPSMLASAAAAAGPLSRDRAVPATPMKNRTLGQHVCSPALPKQIWSSVLSWPCVSRAQWRQQRATCNVQHTSTTKHSSASTDSNCVVQCGLTLPTALEGKARERSMRLHRTPAGMARVPWHSNAAASWRRCRMLYDGRRYDAACQVSVAGIG
jgi:hypothetical protein